jgi:large subunit ribosomal protein L23
VKNPYTIILRPHITEKSMNLSLGDPRIVDEKDLVRKYTFIVDNNANKIEIKRAVEFIYNKDAKKGDQIVVTSVRVLTMPGKKGRRVGARAGGHKPDFKKAVVTLAKGQMLEDYGV